ncbi:helix-turn-helix domain-containing protein [Teichococcus aestuarii]|nr:helix-turn-helix domain-containing protein [Pseudoroseomonas aestuarii]
MTTARRLERATHRRGSGRHGGQLRESGLRVLWTLLHRGEGRAGACDPSLAQIAHEALLARSTVQEAVRRLEDAGILLRVPRRAMADGRWVQVTNAYLFQEPAQWRGASDTGFRSALDSDEKPEEGQGGEVLWEGSAAPAVAPERLRGLLEAVGWGSSATIS